MAMKYVVRVVNGVVVSRGDLRDTDQPASGFMEVSEEVYAQARLGATYDGRTFTPPADRTPRTLSVFDFMLRFTRDERAAIRAKGVTDPMVADFFELVNARQGTGVNLDSPLTVAGLAYLSGQTVDGNTITGTPPLAAGRAAQIRA